jgi:hypothetical protein
MGYWRRYDSMDPSTALGENKENFSLDRSAVKKAYVNHKERPGQGKNAPKVHYWEVNIETTGEKYKFESDGDPSEQVTRAFG